MSETTRIVVVDDHPIVVDGLTTVLSTEADFEIVATGNSGPEAVGLVEQYRPDVLLLDLEMPGGGGVEAISQIQERAPEVRIIVFTAFDRDEQIVGALKAGANGFLLKGSPRHELFQTIRVVARGGSLIEPAVTSKLLRKVRGVGDDLTPQEVKVLNLVAEGRTNRDIGKELFITERTVKFHVSSILSKLGASNRTEAVAISRDRGLLST